MENGHRVAYSDDVQVWFHSELVKEHEIDQARTEKYRKEIQERDERRRFREEERKRKKREYMRLKRLVPKR
jgi:hypothetical protein